MNLGLNVLFSCSQSKSVKVKTAFGLSIDFFRLLLIGVRLHSCFLVSNVFLRSNETSETEKHLHLLRLNSRLNGTLVLKTENTAHNFTHINTFCK